LGGSWLKKSGEAATREAMASEGGYDRALWNQIAEMGIAGLTVATEYGGSGAGPEEVEVGRSWPLSIVFSASLKWCARGWVIIELKR
jgi:alkylation response protein AidB-like acyl-CoA dehydrogenase